MPRKVAAIEEKNTKGRHLGGKRKLGHAVGVDHSRSACPRWIGHGSKGNWPSECLRKLKAGEPLDYYNPDAPFNNVPHERDIAALVATALERGPGGADIVVVGAAGRTTVAEQ
jgi:hypothetical protein